MLVLGKTIVVKGELRASEDLTVEGRIEGPICCEHCSVVLSPSAHVTGDIIARCLTVFGRVEGQLVATDFVDIRREATVAGRVVSKQFILQDGARFTGRVAPQHLEAALRVARYRQAERDDSDATIHEMPTDYVDIDGDTAAKVNAKAR